MCKRDFKLDLAKGFLIVLVVLGHCVQYSFGPEWLISEKFFKDVIFKTIYSFHMPLFMLISGYLFYNSNQKEFRHLIISKLKAIGIPILSYIFLCNMILYTFFLRHGNVIGIIEHYCKSVFFGMTLWFLLSLLLMILTVAILTRIFKKKYLLHIAMFTIFIASLLAPDSIIPSVHKFMFPFFCIGYITKQNDIPLYSSSQHKFLLGTLSLLSIFAICWFNKDTYIYTSGICIVGNYAEQFQIDCKRIVIALIVSYTFMQYINILARHRNVLTKKVSKLGQMSLFIYGMNTVFNIYYSKLTSILSINFHFNYLIPITITLCFLLICCWLYKLLEKTKFTCIALLGKNCVH